MDRGRAPGTAVWRRRPAWNADELESFLGDLLLSIAADGDHIAVTDSLVVHDDRDVYVSGDAGLSWST